MLCQLIYISRQGPDHETALKRGDREAILQISQVNNARDNITGVLVSVDGFFMQYLEGMRAHVTETYNRIVLDPRHHDVTLVNFSDIIQRRFPKWLLNSSDIIQADNELVRSFTHGNAFDPYLLTGDAAMLMLEKLYQHRSTSQPSNDDDLVVVA